MTAREFEEYRQLRATIARRGTARVQVFVVGLAAWAGLLVAVWGLDAPPWAALVSLVMLTGAFEAVFALHVGAERIGRYIQVFLEGPDHGWEHHVMAVGGAGAMKPGGDAIFSPVFLAAVVVNFLPGALASPAPGELVVLIGVHLAALGRILDARRRAAGQRAADLQAFTRLHDGRSPTVD